jgi:asparagine synthetase B (glutamine-hydrolysing)
LRHQHADRKFFSSLNKSSLIGEELAQNVKIIERKKLFSSYDNRAANPTLIEAHKKSIFHPHLQAALERYDRIAAAFSIESRHPFFDVRVVEFCLGLPWQLRTCRGWNKTLLRKDMKTLLPDAVIQGKEKKHPAWRFSIQILNIKRNYFQELLNDELENLRPFVNTRNVNKAWHDFSTGSNFEAVPEIWYAIGLALWLRRQRQLSV